MKTMNRVKVFLWVLIVLSVISFLLILVIPFAPLEERGLTALVFLMGIPSGIGTLLTIRSNERFIRDLEKTYGVKR